MNALTYKEIDTLTKEVEIMSKDESWLPITGYEGLYSISNRGRVRRDASGQGARIGHIIKPQLAAKYYDIVQLCKNGVPKRFYVHRLVAAAFIGPCPKGQEVRHGPKGKSNNDIANLCYGTRIQNCADRLRDGTSNCGEKCGGSKLIKNQIIKIRRLYKSGMSQGEIAKKMRMKQQNISCIVRGVTWRHLPI